MNVIALMRNKSFIPVLVLTILAFSFIGEAIQRAIDFNSLSGYALFGGGILIVSALGLITNTGTKYAKYFFIGGMLLLVAGFYV